MYSNKLSVLRVGPCISGEINYYFYFSHSSTSTSYLRRPLQTPLVRFAWKLSLHVIGCLDNQESIQVSVKLFCNTVCGAELIEQSIVSAPCHLPTWIHWFTSERNK
jgi:hypothetical protein